MFGAAFFGEETFGAVVTTVLGDLPAQVQLSLIGPSRLVVGDLVQLQALIVSLSGVLLNPSVITFQVRSPQFSTTELDVIQDGTGTFHADLSLTAGGTWMWRVACEGLVQGAEEASFYVQPTSFPGA